MHPRRLIPSHRSFAVLAALLLACVAIAGPSPKAAEHKPVAIIAGYPSPDAPLIEFAFRKQHAKVDNFDATWLPVADYSKYSVVVLTGNLARANVTPSTYSPADLKTLEQYINAGGTLILTAGSFDVFHTPGGGTFVETLFGKPADVKDKAIKLLQPKHLWIAPLATEKDLSWLTDAGTLTGGSKGDRILGTDGGQAMLFQRNVGRGQVIYIGWSLSRFLPGGRNLKSTVEDETRYEAQYQVMLNIASNLYPATN